MHSDIQGSYTPTRNFNSKHLSHFSVPEIPQDKPSHNLIINTIF